MSKRNPLRLTMLMLTLTTAVWITAACGGGEPEEHTFELEIRDGALVQEKSLLKVKQGDTVTMVVAADEPVSFHLHGYDIEKEAKPDEPATLKLTADATGSFPFTIHMVTEGDHEEAAGGHHDEEAGDCEPRLPSGAPTPAIRLTASPGKEPGEIDVAVDVDSFFLSFDSTSTELASGHWHLMVDDQLKGMYVQRDVTTAVPSEGEHRVMVGLSDIQHCDYGIDAMTKVVVEQGHAGGEEEATEEDHEENGAEEIELGRLEVQPR